MTVASRYHVRQPARNASTLSGATIARMRSCDSLIRISAGVRVLSRSGTVSRSTCMPPVPALASSEVAQESPAPPRSWIPVVFGLALVLMMPLRSGGLFPSKQRAAELQPDAEDITVQEQQDLFDVRTHGDETADV